MLSILLFVFYDELGRVHREDGPAIQYTNETKYWYFHDRLHRMNGPAIEYCSGSKSWYQNGKLHRIDGPAIENFNGSKYWYYHNKQINCKSQEEFERIIRLKALWQ